ncbi:alpha/beta fold hydrolase [Spongiimicrobium salis]|uniref:alpha/beta fold hydrolase n=1 Tax=Spongiimicrobium salis TaxID=1667022 RepID=UPI00374DA316
MKHFTILLLALFIQSNVFAQSIATPYPFDVQIKGKGKPIILIPGLACSGEVWNETVAELQDQYECHVLTLAGFSTQKPITLDSGFLPKIERSIKTYIQKELKEKPILIGHSLGGFLSMSLASHDSALLEKIIIVDSYPFMAAAYNPNATEKNIVPQAQMMKRMILQTPDSTYAKQQKVTMGTMMRDPQKIELSTQWAIASSKETIGQAMYELMTTDLRDEVAHISVPTLVLGNWFAGKDYGITKAMTQQNFESQFQKSTFVTIEIAEKAKHFIMWDEPNWFYDKVENFIANE